MKKVLIIAIAILINVVASAQANVQLIITNNSKQVLKYLGEDGDWNKGLVRDHISNGADILIGGNAVHIYTTSFGCGVDGWISYKSADGKGKIWVNYDNPSIGSSEYSTKATENYTAIITSINSDVNPQQVYVEVRGGDETPPKPRYNLITTGRNTINGSITWNEALQGNPINNDWNSIFNFTCTVPTIFQVADGGTATYNGEKGYFMGSVQSGTLLLGALESLPNNIKKLNFSIVNVAENVQLNKFDVTIKTGDLWVAPASVPKPAPAFKYYAGTILNSPASFVSTNLCVANFSIVAGWGNPTPGATNTGDISSALTQRKRNSVLPANAFVQIGATKNVANNNNMIKQNINVKSNAIKNVIKIRQ
jgi:hypothetical protein